MNYSDILINILTSSFVISIATYFLQKRIDKKFSKIEEFQKTLITIRKERHDTVLKTLQDIWDKIIELEYYIRHDLARQYKDAQKTNEESVILDSLPLLTTFVFIEKRSIFLPDKLSTQTKNFFINHLQNTYNGYIDGLNKLSRKEISLEDFNIYVSLQLSNDYQKEREQLKKAFEQQSREILYGDN